MTWLDWTIVGLIFIGTVNGLRRGFVYSLFGLVGLIAALVLGWSYAPTLTEFFETSWGWQSRLAEYLMNNIAFPKTVGGFISPGATYGELAGLLLTVVAFLLIFLAVRTGCAVAARLLHMVVGWGFTGVLDRVMGGIFGLFSWAIAISVVLGTAVTASASISWLAGFSRAVEASDLGGEMVRLFYVLSPLRDHVLDVMIP